SKPVLDGAEHQKYFTQIRKLVNDDKLDEALYLLEEYENSSRRLSPIAYNIIINTFIRSYDLRNALAMLDRMLLHDVSPNAVTIGTLLKGVLHFGEVTDVERVYSLEKKYKVQRTVVTYNTIIDYHLKQGQMNEALKLFNELIEKGLKPSISTFSPIIDALMKNG